MKNLILHKKGEPSFITYVRKRLANNLNFICLYTGGPGIGKTWNGISMSWQLDPEFDAERQITFDFKQTMELVNSKWFKAKKIKVILFDEPQISISNRNWQSMTNKLLNYLLSTFRHQNIILILCAPYADFLDSQAMKLLHCIFECRGVNKKKKLSRVRPKLQQYNAQLKKTYNHSLHVINDGQVEKMTFWDITRPPQHLIDVYERRKTEFTTKLNREIIEKLNEVEMKEKLGDKKPLTETQQGILECWEEGIFQQKEISAKLNRTAQIVSLNTQYMRRKGYFLEKYREMAKN